VTTPTALAYWSGVFEMRARLTRDDRKIGPREAYGGTRAAT
jgi:hypothetical protein